MLGKPGLLFHGTLLVAALAAAGEAAAECTAWHRKGALVAARERPEPAAHLARAGYDSDGWPAIAYGDAFYAMPFMMQQFTRLQKCLQLSRHIGEVKANCYALITMRERGLSAADEEALARHHIRFSTLPAEYGGSGQAFWAATLECAGSREPAIDQDQQLAAGHAQAVIEQPKER
jgi:hypothetical protein